MAAYEYRDPAVEAALGPLGRVPPSMRIELLQNALNNGLVWAGCSRGSMLASLAGWVGMPMDDAGDLYRFYEWAFGVPVPGWVLQNDGLFPARPSEYSRVIVSQHHFRGSEIRLWFELGHLVAYPTFLSRFTQQISEFDGQLGYHLALGADPRRDPDLVRRTHHSVFAHACSSLELWNAALRSARADAKRLKAAGQPVRAKADSASPAGSIFDHPQCQTQLVRVFTRFSNLDLSE